MSKKVRTNAMEYLAKKIYTKNGVTKENPMEGKKVLHLGCGKSKISGTIGVDSLSLKGVDVVHNLDVTPWPVDGNSVSAVFAHSVVEHISDLPAFFKEVHRVCEGGARVVMAVPYFRHIDSFTDITHKHFFTHASMDYFMENGGSLGNYDYTNEKFRKIGFWYGWPQESSNALVRLFKNFITKHPAFYDQYLSLLFPVKIIIWELEVVKDK